ncbi:MAG: STAS domain-containing protein [Candidatus Zixiibacteriota bacterium]
MNINDELKDDILIMKLGGKVMGGNDADLFQGRLQKYISSGQRKVIIDLAHVKQIGSMGLGMLLSASHMLNKYNGKLALSNIPESVESLLVITKLITVFDTKDSIEEAEVALRLN